MKPDIQNRNDIEKLIDAFYENVKKDDLIGFYFTNVANVNWQKHLPVMYNFWENVIFHTGNYTGNPMERHMALHLKHPMKTEHFNRWLFLFIHTVDNMYSGTVADSTKQKTKNIATVMQIKLLK